MSMYTHMKSLKEYLVSFGTLMDHTVSTKGLGGGEGLGAYKALVGTLPSVAPHMACKDRTSEGDV